MASLLAELALGGGWRLDIDDPASRFGGSERHTRLECCVQALEEERRKIEAFKRELPMCMQLVCDAIQALKLHLNHVQQQQQQQQQPAGSIDQQEERSRQNETNRIEESPSVSKGAVRPQAKHGVPGILFNTSGGGAFSPFVRQPNDNTERVASTSNPAPPTSNAHPAAAAPAPASSSSSDDIPDNNKLRRLTTAENQHRKARRCWSPELHRRFLSALQQLGGSHVATPKQIREVMKVEGLTNDEVKSHLQKYRLHTRRLVPPPSSQSAAAAAAAAAQVVVLSGLWVPSEFAASAATSAAAAAVEQNRYDYKAREELSGKQQAEEEIDMDDGDVTETEDSKQSPSPNSPRLTDCS